jgi:hypothetical protein
MIFLVDVVAAFSLVFLYWIFHLMCESYRKRLKTPLNKWVSIFIITLATLIFYILSFAVRMAADIAIFGNNHKYIAPINVFTFLVFYYGIKYCYRALRLPATPESVNNSK